MKKWATVRPPKEGEKEEMRCSGAADRLLSFSLILDHS
jgi:hypothetical protein